MLSRIILRFGWKKCYGHLVCLQLVGEKGNSGCVFATTTPQGHLKPKTRFCQGQDDVAQDLFREWATSPKGRSGQCSIRWTGIRQLCFRAHIPTTCHLTVLGLRCPSMEKGLGWAVLFHESTEWQRKVNTYRGHNPKCPPKAWIVFKASCFILKTYTYSILHYKGVTFKK